MSTKAWLVFIKCELVNVCIEVLNDKREGVDNTRRGLSKDGDQRVLNEGEMR